MTTPAMSPTLSSNPLPSPDSDFDATFSLPSARAVVTSPKPKRPMSPRTFSGPRRPLSPGPSSSRFAALSPPLKRNSSTRSVSSEYSLGRDDVPSKTKAGKPDPINTLFGPLHLASSFRLYHPDPMPKLSRCASASGGPSLCSVEAEARGMFGGAPIRPASKRRCTLQDSGAGRQETWRELQGILRGHVERSEFVHVDAV
jgi:hypothetical protein